MYDHIEKVAKQIKRGADSVEGVEAKLWQVPETLPEEVLGKMGAPPKSDVPIITPNELVEADNIIFSFPTRFGEMAVQFKAFMDATSGLWGSWKLAGKPAGIFYSTGSQGGGQETTPAGMFEMEKVKGGSPYGVGTFASDCSWLPSELKLGLVFHQGKCFANIAKKLKGSACISAPMI